MSIAVIITDRNSDALCQNLQQQLPGVNIQQWPQINNPEQVRLAVLWDHPAGITKDMSALKMVVSMGAGMDHIEADRQLPADVKKDRIVTQVLQQNMAQYVLQHILFDHRQHQAYQQNQAKKRWAVLETDEAMPTVGFLGLGKLGGFVADRCADLGFKTMAWTATQVSQRHPCFHGTAGLQKVCHASQYLVVLLPLNTNTQHIIKQQTLSWCKPNMTLINVGRGGHVKQNDLIQALDSNTIKQAVLDVFEEEPLPSDHPFWQHPKITITPHSSSRSDVEQTAQQVAAFYRSLTAES